MSRTLVGDRDDMVVKALSWALRELMAPDPEAVRAFLAERRGTGGLEGRPRCSIGP